ncbi:hypothetical protein AB0K02_18715 [Streptomyces sp. NPDC049597]|uniref:WXG100 family type VII secretion target n=1 Tax=Streptomyces sp. NPDC049597 TaxID=3155276 RepID=UPI0034174926
MSEEKQPQPKPTLTPQEQEQQEQEAQIHGQFAATDMVERANDIFESFGFGPGGSIFGKTAFDGRKLNEMLDLLESANPEALEEAGDALERATKAINDAAKDLNDFVKQTKAEWHGEGAEAFQTYGSEVVGYAWGIGKFANAVGAQMKVASTGLASVRNARPPRDTRAVQKDPKDFKIPEQSPDNLEYQKALQVEKDRQEAINQMNRLASFYAVSQGTLAAQEPPKPPAAYKAAVPPPSGSKEDTSGGGSAATGEASARPSSAITETGDTGIGERTHRTGMPGKAGTVTDSTSMEIDSVTTVTPPTTNPSPTQPTVVNTPNQGPGPVTTPPLTSFGPPGRATSPRMGDSRTAGGQPYKAVGREGTRGTYQPLGRPATSTGRAPIAPTSGPTSPTAGRSPMVGRPTTPGIPGGGSPGRQAPNTGRGQAPIVGRPGGQGQPATGRSTSPTGSRNLGNGIVGGTPQRPAGAGTPSRIPRGTVIGAEASAAGRSTAARPSQAGVVGANAANTPARLVGRGTPSANGVVGTPRAAGARSGTGGGGPVGGRGGQRRDDEQDRDGTARPDFLTDDEETRANRRRGVVPPVID